MSDNPILTAINLILIYHQAILKVHLTELQIKPLQVQSVLISPCACDVGDFW